MFKISEILSTLFYIGHLKPFPGTIGSLVSLIIIYFLNLYVNFYVFIFIFIFTLIISPYLINIYSKKIQKIDASEIILDEFLGVFLIFIFWDYYNSLNIYINLILIFILFRFFDISKLYPSNLIEKKLKNSYGVILDDIVAGIYTIIILVLINAI